MIKVICNASPIIGLLGINKLNLLWELFDEVVIPEAVLLELYAGNRVQESFQIKKAVDDGHITVIEIHNNNMVDFLYGKLHRGDLETVIGAKEDPSIRFAIIDERAARKFAAYMLVDTLGILGVLTYAMIKGKIEAVRPYMVQLIQNGYRISDAIYNQILKSENEL